MQAQKIKLAQAAPGDVCSGFRLIKKEPVPSKAAWLYTLRHEKTGAGLLYFDRADENKTFSVCFKTLPEDDTGVFHILEHSVLNGSRKYPVKEPFVSLLQSSMQTFLNAMTFGDKTVFPVSSRNEKDFFNLMRVYLDAVFCPMIYDRPEIFMQEGWHYEFENADAQPYYNGVVYSEMKGVFADVDRIMEAETSRLLFPDTCYGFVSGGHPEHIPELSYSRFVDTHRRFYHPSNARIILDGSMDVDAVLACIDGEYLSKYTYREPDFDFVMQTPKTGEKTVFFEAREGDKPSAHMVAAKILCTHRDAEKLYAAQILADYLTGSNEAPLKRAFLERGLGQDVTLEVSGGVLQPTMTLIARNTSRERFDRIRAFLPEAAETILAEGLEEQTLLACLERMAFRCREIHEPYGVVLALGALDGWLYGGDPLTYIEDTAVFDALREKIHTSYFADLLREMLADPGDKCYVYLLSSTEKGKEDAQREKERAMAAAAAWDDRQRRQIYGDFVKMQQWQQTPDSEQDLRTLPHLALEDVPEETEEIPTRLQTVEGVPALKVETQTGGIVYLRLFFDVSDFSQEELRLLRVLGDCLGELSTRAHTAQALQARVKTTMGSLRAGVELMARPGELRACRPYLRVSAAMLEEKVPQALEVLAELLTQTLYEERERIGEIIAQSDYFLKQSLISNGHSYAIRKALAPFRGESALREILEGESYVRWFGALAERFPEDGQAVCRRLGELAGRAFAGNRLFVGYGGSLDEKALAALIRALPTKEMGEPAAMPDFESKSCAIEIPADVGYSAVGMNLYAQGGSYTGACSVLASLTSFAYLWNMVRVQGGAYGTGMRVRSDGDVFCYSYRDPNLENTRKVYEKIPDFLEEYLGRGEPLDDVIIGAVNTTDPLVGPADACDMLCYRYLRGITHERMMQLRKELLHTTPQDLMKLAELLRGCLSGGGFCAVGNREAVAFVSENA